MITRMNYYDIIAFTTGLVQFAVAGYALRLNRLFGAARVGWSLFSAFFLLALLHLAQTLIPGIGTVDAGASLDLLYAPISLLLLVGMAHLESVLKERARTEQEERRMRAGLEREVQKKTAYLTRAIEELQTEIDERRRMEIEIESTHLELRAVSRKAKMARITDAVLRSVGEMLQSINTSANLVSDQMKQSKIANVVNVGAIIRQHAGDLDTFMARNPMGQKLPGYIAQLAEHLAEEQATLLTELDSVKRNLKKIEALQRHYAQIASMTDEDTDNYPEEARSFSDRVLSLSRQEDVAVTVR